MEAHEDVDTNNDSTQALEQIKQAVVPTDKEAPLALSPKRVLLGGAKSFMTLIRYEDRVLRSFRELPILPEPTISEKRMAEGGVSAMAEVITYNLKKLTYSLDPSKRGWSANWGLLLKAAFPILFIVLLIGLLLFGFFYLSQTASSAANQFAVLTLKVLGIILLIVVSTMGIRFLIKLCAKI